MDYAKHTDGKGRIKDADEFLADDAAERALAKAKSFYAERRTDIAKVIDWLELEVEKHEEFARKEGIDYGHCGDLGEVERILIQALAFLAQRDEKDIEDALADAAAGRKQARGKSSS